MLTLEQYTEAERLGAKYNYKGARLSGKFTDIFIATQRFNRRFYSVIPPKEYKLFKIIFEIPYEALSNVGKDKIERLLEEYLDLESKEEDESRESLIERINEQKLKLETTNRNKEIDYQLQVEQAKKNVATVNARLRKFEKYVEKILPEATPEEEDVLVDQQEQIISELKVEKEVLKEKIARDPMVIKFNDFEAKGFFNAYHIQGTGSLVAFSVLFNKEYKIYPVDYREPTFEEIEAFRQQLILVRQTASKYNIGKGYRLYNKSFQLYISSERDFATDNTQILTNEVGFLTENLDKQDAVDKEGIPISASENFFWKIQKILANSKELLGYREIYNGWLNLDGFVLLFVKNDFVEGSDFKSCWNRKKIDGSDNLCGKIALEMAGHQIKCDYAEISEIDNYIKYIKENKVNMCVIENTCCVAREKLEIIKKRSCIKFNNGKENINLYKIDISDLRTRILCGDYKTMSHALYVYDRKSNHIDKVISLKDLFYNPETGDIYRRYIKAKSEFGIYLKAKEAYNMAVISGMFKGKAKLKERYLFLDYEAIIKWRTRCTTSYSHSLLDLSMEQLVELSNSDKNKNVDRVNEIIDFNSSFYLGYESGKIIKDYLDARKDVKYTIVTFNGSNYDHQILYNSLLCLDETYATNPFWTGTKLVDFTIDHRHTMFDLRKHLVGSLDGLCKSFKVNTAAKGSFDHAEAQRLYDQGILIEEMSKNDNLKKYNILDVASLAIIFCRYKQAVDEMVEKEPLLKSLKLKSIDQFKTIGSYVFEMCSSFWKAKGIKLPNFKDPSLHKHYNSQIKDSRGGRVQLNQVCMLENMASQDVTSAYPFHMLINSVYFPCGEIIESSYENMPSDKMGFFHCTVDQSNLHKDKKIICERVENGNDWRTDNVIQDVFISTVKIDQLLEYGCSVQARDGYYFTDKIKNYELFEPLVCFMKEKNRQDILKETDSPDYNPALREVCKLAMNSMSGKMIEKLHLDKVEEVTIAKYEKLLKNDKYYQVTLIRAMNEGNKLIVSYRIKADTQMHKTRPIYIGNLIYDYQHKYMYDHIFSKVDFINTDTDSAHMTQTECEKWLKYATITKVPHWPETENFDPKLKDHMLYVEGSKVFGSFDNEFAGGYKKQYYCGKKLYLAVGDKKGVKIEKMSLKGIGKKDRVLPEKFNIPSADKLAIKYSLIPEKMRLSHYLFDIHDRYPSLDDCKEEVFKRLIFQGKILTISPNFIRELHDKDGKIHSTISVDYRIKETKITIS
jgi:hypothetical protein